jgi:uncharacterized protein (DUF983 family)
MPDTVAARWQPMRVMPKPAWPMPTLAQALRRGAAARCPACGQSRLFQGWLRVHATCPNCTAPLGALRADDAPPYFTIFIVGHFILGLAVALDLLTRLSVAAELAIFLPATAILSVALLRPVKGATVGLMLRLRMETISGPAG